MKKLKLVTLPLAVVADRFLLIFFTSAFSLFGLRKNNKEPMCFLAVGDGNMGDRALLESCVANLPNSTLFVGTGDTEALFSKVGLSDNRIRVLTSLYGLPAHKHLLNLLSLSKVLSKSSRIFIVGADNLDGAYSNLLSALHWNVAIAGTYANTEVTMLGFSWNTEPSKMAVKLKVLAQMRGVILCARDSLSADRLRTGSSEEIIHTADLVFSTKYFAKLENDEQEEVSNSKKIAIIAGTQMRGLNREEPFEPEDFRPILEAIGSSYEIHLVPSVARSRQNEPEILRSVMDHFKTQFNIRHHATVPTPNEFFSLCQSAKLLVTFRMHPAVIAMQALLPTLMFEYQGKMLGLAEDMGVKEFVIAHSEPMESGVPAITKLKKMNDQTRIVLEANLSGQRRRSDLNFKPYSELRGSA
jgi:polysaccharide pyruvyl transferase WcaK-like protein